MAYNPPTYGESGEVYTDNVRNSLAAIKSQAELAQAAADGLNASVAAAAQTADEALERAAAAEAFVQSPTDDRVAGLVEDSASATAVALAGRVARSLALSIGTNFSAGDTTGTFSDLPESTITFTAPANGRVSVEYQAGYTADAANSLEINIREAGVDLAGTTQRVARPAAYTQGRFSYKHVVSDLTPGTSYTWQIGYRRGDGGGLVTVEANPTLWGQAVAEVRSLPL